MPSAPSAAALRVLVLGVYVGDRPNTISHLVRRYASSPGVAVEQRWVALNGTSSDPLVAAVTSSTASSPASKFALLNTLLRDGDAARFDFIAISDDDIYVPNGVIPAFLAHQRRFDFALAQPARTWLSHYDHAFGLRRPWLKARRTRFVECGPLVSFRSDAAALLLPFDEDSPLWGLDLVWPRVLAERGLRMGIVDAVAVEHSVRRQAASYDKPEQERAMQRYLAQRPHLTLAEACVVLERHWSAA